MSEPTPSKYPANWLIGQDYNPNDHLIQLERFDKRTNRKVISNYLQVQGRLMWFIRDQRNLIDKGLAQVPYVVRTELVEIDREAGWAHFKTYVRDVLGNEATMYGSESVKDFGDYAEKASTKGLGRALLMLGYGTTNADELDELDRVVDAPVARQQMQAPTTTPPTQAPRPQSQPNTTRPAAPTTQATPTATGIAMATDKQKDAITKLSTALNRTVPDFATLTLEAARSLMTTLSHDYETVRKAS